MASGILRLLGSILGGTLGLLLGALGFLGCLGFLGSLGLLGTLGVALLGSRLGFLGLGLGSCLDCLDDAFCGFGCGYRASAAIQSR